MTFQPPPSIKDYANTCKVFVFALTVRSETENDGGRNLDNNKKRWGNENEGLNAQPFLPRGKYKHCRKKISRREKRKKRRVIHLFFSCICFSSNGCKTSNMGINGFTSQANKWATLPQ